MNIILVKCKCHGNKIERNTAFKVVVNDKNEYYCTEKDYLFIKEEKESRKNCLDNINKVFGYVVTNTILSKELGEISKAHTFKKINSYIVDNFNFLEKVMNKDFSSEYGKIKYFTTILKNNLKDYKPKTPEPIKKVNDEVVKMKYKPRERKKSLVEYLEEMEE